MGGRDRSDLLQPLDLSLSRQAVLSEKRGLICHVSSLPVHFLHKYMDALM